MTHELSVTRHIAAPREIVWRAFWERMADWWCPKPWTTELVEQDARPGGRAAMVMRGPAGETAAQEGVYLEVTAPARVVFTDAFAAGWLPQGPFIVGEFRFDEEAGGTRYTATARHWSEEALRRHEEMGFEAGWSAVAAQLAEIAEEMAR